MSKQLIILLTLTILILTSCFKEDDPVFPPDPGDVTTDTIEMTLTYKYQVFYDLGREEIVSQNIKSNYDLGFEAGPEGWRIILNTSCFMYIGNSGFDNIDIPFDTAGIKWKYDPSHGNLDSTAVGNWVTFDPVDSTQTYTNHVYVVDRGYDPAGNLRGFKKVQFNEVSSDSYRLTWSNLDGSDKNTFMIEKDPDVSFVWFSFNEGGKMVDVEPYKGDWDLVFTQYTTLLYTDAGDPYPYLVTGTLSNRNGIRVARDTLMDFRSVVLDDVTGLDYSNDLDMIGYDWKVAIGDPTSGNITYEIAEGLNYIILDHEGFYYKLRFISFYNSVGEKGYPTIEFQRL